MEYDDLKIGDLVKFEIKGISDVHIGLIMGVFEDPFMIGATICEVYLSANDYIYLAESELKCWKLLSTKENV